MPSNKNILHGDDVEKLLLRAEEFIRKWFHDTATLLSSKVRSSKPVDHLCITSLTVSFTYAKAIIILLSNGLRMPAKASLRVIFELAAKLAWCLRCPDDVSDPDELVEEKIRRWAKSSVREKVRLLNDFEDFWPREAIPQLKTRREDLEKLFKDFGDVKELPPFRQLVGQLPDSGFLELYARCYSVFNDAVHLDIYSLGNTVTEDGTVLSVEYDSKEPVEDLIRYCQLVERMIFFLVRANYDWDTKQLMEYRI